MDGTSGTTFLPNFSVPWHSLKTILPRDTKFSLLIPYCVFGFSELVHMQIRQSCVGHSISSKKTNFKLLQKSSETTIDLVTDKSDHVILSIDKDILRS